MYEKFLEEVGNFVFMENQPESADIIFVPGNSYPYMAEKAAELYRLGLYKVQVGAFQQIGNAIQMEQRLRDAGYSTIIVTK